MSGAPIIGICAPLERARWAVWDMPAALVGEPYLRAVWRAGGRSILIPPDPALESDPDSALDGIDGLMLVGGADIDACRYGAVPHADIRDYYGITGAVACTRGHDLVCSVVTPLKPYEAMAYARPVVVSDIPALREMVEDRVTGRLVRAEDPVALARVLEELADDPDERRALGARAAAWVREHRTWQRVADGYRPAYAYARDAFARRTQERP